LASQMCIHHDVLHVEKFEDTKGITRNRKSKNREYNGDMKMYQKSGKI